MASATTLGPTSSSQRCQRSRSSDAIRPLPPLPCSLTQLPSRPPMLERSQTSPNTAPLVRSPLSPRPLPSTPMLSPLSVSTNIGKPPHLASTPSSSTSSSRSVSPIGSASSSTSHSSCSPYTFTPSIHGGHMLLGPRPQSPKPNRRLPIGHGGPLQPPRLQMDFARIATPVEPSPMTPAPSPGTTRRKRVARLQRTFGEELPEYMLATITPAPGCSRVQSLDRKSPKPSLRASPTTLIFISPIESDDVSGTSEDDGNWEDVQDALPTDCLPPRVSPLVTQKALPPRPPDGLGAHRKRISKPPFTPASSSPTEGANKFFTRWAPRPARSAKRRSAKWVQIKGGKEVESGYADVIQALREL